MFDAIAGRYDFLNHLLSAGFDRRWRARAVIAAGLSGTDTVLDLCTGTGDLALAASTGASRARRIVGIDFSPAMLQVARAKVGRAGLAPSISLVCADGSRLPLRHASVDAATLAFGIRNVDDRPAVCGELRRVLRAGGRLVVLEFSLPHTPGLRLMYRWYFRRVLPLVGRLISRHPSAYAYLPESVSAFPAPDDFVRELQAAGFERVEAVPLTFGVVHMFTATRGPDDTSTTRAGAPR
jgi:demethylmenaquinone methyltransferase / 2-methoxy-6-polyprenyl-1,4-benzoquinol methylase